MEGITPTLAFAALFFGLSGHPQDKADSALSEAISPARYQVRTEIPCPDFASTVEDVKPWQGFLAQDAALAAAPLGDRAEFAATSEELDDGSYMPLDEPILVFEEHADADGCGTPAPQK